METVMDKVYRLRIQALESGLDAWGIVLDGPTLDKLRAEALSFMVCRKSPNLNNAVEEIFGMKILPVGQTAHNMTIVDELLGRKILGEKCNL